MCTPYPCIIFECTSVQVDAALASVAMHVKLIVSILLMQRGKDLGAWPG